MPLGSLDGSQTHCGVLWGVRVGQNLSMLLGLLQKIHLREWIDKAVILTPSGTLENLSCVYFDEPEA